MVFELWKLRLHQMAVELFLFPSCALVIVNLMILLISRWNVFRIRFDVTNCLYGLLTQNTEQRSKNSLVCNFLLRRKTCLKTVHIDWFYQY